MSELEKEKDCVSLKEDKALFITLHLNAKLQPVDRGDIYEDSLGDLLEEIQLGYVDGGGTLLSKTGEVENCDVEIVLNRREDIDKLTEIVNAMRVPKGSSLQIQEGEDIAVGNLEGMAIYFNGTELPPEVYETCDINYAISEIESLLDDKGAMYSYWEGPEDTAVYFYGESFKEMEKAVQSFTGTYPLCEKCRIIQIA